MQGNLFMEDLKLGLEQHAEVIWDYEEFWKCENEYDIIHLHWPDFLSYEVQKWTWGTDPLPAKMYSKIEECLQYWKENSTIVYTRHIQYPHSRNDEDVLKLYRMVTSYCDTVVHFANYSVEQFKAWYPEHKGITHVVIPHHNYASMPNNSNKASARQHLNINPDATVMIVFGLIKEHEKELINKAFNYIPSNNKVLLAPKWKINRRKIGYIRLREWVWKFEKWLATLNPKRRIDLGFIEDEDAHWYLNAADFLFIPRTSELNSGNITLGCTFGLVVVGYNGADIGEILNETDNPTFDIVDEQSLKVAIENAVSLARQKHGEKNKELAIKEWNVPMIASEYINVMKETKLRTGR
ncbi:glycosyltransferase [Paucihalobacter ruber]|uniref:Glycosyltransferase n=1 Tax=Paucihalobacter ruber TaxID=2567861 RepID=A0A506PU45_9FLAO|nr:glycosyltransferase [Paucihalobacter ruber]TPV35750.1 glycosyltransferase [Paucihalobacter ruber]